MINGSAREVSDDPIPKSKFLLTMADIEICFESKNMTKAISILEKAIPDLSEQPCYIETLLLLGNVRRLNKDFCNAEKAFLDVQLVATGSRSIGLSKLCLGSLYVQKALNGQDTLEIAIRLLIESGDHFRNCHSREELAYSNILLYMAYIRRGDNQDKSNARSCAFTASQYLKQAPIKGIIKHPNSHLPPQYQIF